MIAKWIEREGKLYIYKGYRTGRDSAYRKMRDLKWFGPHLNCIKICADEISNWSSKYYIYGRPRL